MRRGVLELAPAFHSLLLDGVYALGPTGSRDSTAGSVAARSGAGRGQPRDSRRRPSRGGVSVREWLRDLRRRDERAHAKCVARIGRQAEMGYELRRPEADSLRDGIHERRVRRGNVNYRILHFFHGRNVAVLVHALAKQSEVPDRDIDLAREGKELVTRHPDKHIHEE